MTDNRKRVCLLTGASGRLGSLFCRLYGHRYEIAAVYCSTQATRPRAMTWHVDPLEPSARKPVREHRYEMIQADLLQPDEIARVVRFALRMFGRVDLLVNAAAVVNRASLLGAELSIASVRRMLDLNAVVPLQLAVELAKQFWRGRADENKSMNRSIVNLSSTSGAYVFSGDGQSAYGASKAALNMLTCHMAEEFSAIGIRANSLAPDSFPRSVTTESVCDAIARLDEGSITGKLLMLEADGETVI
jgi:NAD(P)-dependent dehydrogenase (short-subunit alcohol dehydrogenase family)